MTYTYGLRGVPSVGKGSIGLPRTYSPNAGSTFTRIVTAGSGFLIPPEGSQMMRVAVIGGGGNTNSTTGGGGGGCAASKIVQVTPIHYTVGSSNQNSIAIFSNYFLIGGAGSVGTAGIASGGDFNVNGGNTNGANGGGGAGPLFISGGRYFGWGIASGAPGRSGQGSRGGSGTGCPQNVFDSYGEAQPAYPAPNWPWGGAPNFQNGGVMGGGANANGTGGVGGLVVEWFY